jgi:hypothetical protein
LSGWTVIAGAAGAGAIDGVVIRGAGVAVFSDVVAP